MPKRKSETEAQKEDHKEQPEKGKKPSHNGSAEASGPFSTFSLPTGGKGFLLGPRIPKDYFLTKGFGETDSGGGVDPWETGSYDLALEKAKIQNFNIVTYTSCLPPEANEISIQNALPNFHHGAVLECIMAAMNGVQGDRISAGVGIAMVRHKGEDRVIGGFAAEYKGHAKEKDVKDILQNDLNSIFGRRYPGDDYELMGTNFTTIVHEVAKGYGTVLASVCFATYILPILPVP